MFLKILFIEVILYFIIFLTIWCVEAQESAENFTSELDQVKITLKQTEEEKSRLEEELTRVNYWLNYEHIIAASTELSYGNTQNGQYRINFSNVQK